MDRWSVDWPSEENDTVVTNHDGIPRTSIRSNGLEIRVTAACRVLDGSARVPQIRCDEAVDMFEVLPSWNPVILCFGWRFWEVVLKVPRINVSENVPQHLAVLYVLPALYLLGRLKCLHLATSAGCNRVPLRIVVPISARLLPTRAGPSLPCRSNDGCVVWRMMCRQVYRSQIMLSGTRELHCNYVLCQKLDDIHPRVRGNIHIMTRTCQAVHFRGLVESPIFLA